MSFRFVLLMIFVLYFAATLKIFASDNLYTLASNSNYAIKSFSKAKKYLPDIYRDKKQTFYCGCEFQGKNISPDRCGYIVRKNAKRGSRLEWEHIVPASRFGKPLKCWQQREQFERCIKKSGKTLSGRKCCRRVNPIFRAMEADMMNLVPSVGELNGDRSNYKFATVQGEKRKYGACDFEVDSRKKTVEPNREIQGDIARIYFYMHKKYGMPLVQQEINQFTLWANNDPPDEWEIRKSQRVNGLLQALEEHQISEKRFVSD